MRKNYVKYVQILAAILLIAGGIYLLNSDLEGGFFASKKGFIYATFLFIFLGWGTFRLCKKIYVYTSEILEKYRNIERLLIDMRDKGKTFYAEKRKFPRISTEGKVSARLTEKKSTEKLFSVRDMSYGGALLKSKKKDFRYGERVNLNMYLPLFPQPIDIAAKIVRINGQSKKKNKEFDVGVEYLDITKSDRQRLIETIKTLTEQEVKNADTR